MNKETTLCWFCNKQEVHSVDLSNGLSSCIFWALLYYSTMGRGKKHNFLPIIIKITEHHLIHLNFVTVSLNPYNLFATIVMKKTNHNDWFYT